MIQSPDTTRKSVGVCLGASTVSFVKTSLNRNNEIHVEEVLKISYEGNPKSVFVENFRKFNPAGITTVITGRKFKNIVNLASISESEATEIAVGFVSRNGDKFAAVASMGAETFLVYTLDDDGRITNLISKNQCASGTGEFFLQQIGRMNLSISEAVEISCNSEPFKVSGRCSVFCKSDCTHALNKGVPKDQVASGLARMISEKVEELLKKAAEGKYLIVGGVTQNQAVINFLKIKYPQIHIPEEATYYEALGASIYGLRNSVSEVAREGNLINESVSSFAFHPPLQDAVNRVHFKTMELSKAKDGDECIVGLDVGSTTTKGLVMRYSDNAILASDYLYTNGNPIKAAKEVYISLLKQVPEKINITGLGVTGSGRHITALHAETDGIINEIIAHARAAVYFDPEVDTIFEIGGQDAKYTYIINEVPADYAMNEACSAGTGSFIEEAALESLNVKLLEIEGGAMASTKPLNFRDQCAALIGSDIKTALQENFNKNDILAGLVYSICMNYSNRVKGKRPVGKKIYMQGGVCYNKAIPIAMASITGKEIIVPTFPGLMGAYGTALKIKENIELGFLERRSFSLEELIQTEFSSGKSFICKDKVNHCDRGCEINVYTVRRGSFFADTDPLNWLLPLLLWFYSPLL